MQGKSPSFDDSDVLVAAWRAGNLQALGPLAERYRAYLLAVARRLLEAQLPGESSSVVQEGLLAVAEHREQFRGTTAAEFLGWLTMIVRNKALQRLKRGRKVQPLPEGSGAEMLVDNASSPSARASRREQAARLHEALARLPQQYRDVLVWRNLEELSYEEIASRLTISAGAVRQLWVRAVRKLRAELGDDDDFQAESG
ncbi:MAG TPA: sigma-70 family RNA polymerase sigma factor [Gemmataceae bacterium]|nr:sigma-70 family RNA polymerase sigma factor [Gemmataceae bacterium]